VHGRPVNSTSVLVAWSRPPAAHRNGLVIRYRILYAAAAAADQHDDEGDGGGAVPRRRVSSVSVPSTQLSHLLTGLDRWTQYRVWVAASTGAGEGPVSDVIVVQTDEDGT